MSRSGFERAPPRLRATRSEGFEGRRPSFREEFKEAPSTARVSRDGSVDGDEPRGARISYHKSLDSARSSLDDDRSVVSTVGSLSAYSQRRGRPPPPRRPSWQSIDRPPPSPVADSPLSGSRPDSPRPPPSPLVMGAVVQPRTPARKFVAVGGADEVEAPRRAATISTTLPRRASRKAVSTMLPRRASRERARLVQL